MGAHPTQSEPPQRATMTLAVLMGDLQLGPNVVHRCTLHPTNLECVPIGVGLGGMSLKTRIPLILLCTNHTTNSESGIEALGLHRNCKSGDT